MSNIILKIMTIGALIALFAGSILTFMSLMLYIIGLITVATNTSIIGDILALVQIWLPFNLMSLMMWVMTATALYITYKISIFLFNQGYKLLNA